MDEIKVSVCMVTYNHERYIAQAVESVLAQRTNFPIEIVIGEDCSTDSTCAILRDLASRHPTRIHLRLAERNHGAKTNFLGAVSSCRGKYVALLEGDDYWSCPDKLQKQVDALEARPDWAICFHPTECIYEDEMQGQSLYPLDWQQPEATFEDLLAANFIPTNSVMFRNRLFPQFPAWFGELKLGDWPLHLLNAACGNIGFLPDVMSVYRVHRNGLWSGEAPETCLIAIVEMLNAIDRHFAGERSGAIERHRKRAIGDLVRELDSMRGVINSHQAMRDNYNGVADERDALSASLESLFVAHQSLTESHRKLEAFYNTWSRSLAGKFVREMRRLAKQFTRLGYLARRPIRAVSESQRSNDCARSEAA